VAKVRKQQGRQASAMPAELERFRLADWTDPTDVDDFRPSAGAGPEQVAEERFAHMAARAKVRQTVARDRWRAAHEGVEVPVGTRRQTTP
jgi:hypothetical protein